MQAGFKPYLRRQNPERAAFRAFCFSLNPNPMHYVYILYSRSADKYYVGQTPDIETRLLFPNQFVFR